MTTKSRLKVLGWQIINWDAEMNKNAVGLVITWYIQEK